MSQHDKEIEETLETLSVLEPTLEDAPRPVAVALSRLRSEIEPKSDHSIWWRFNNMFKRRYVLTTALAAVILIIALSIPGVRAAASDFLGLFRVQKFTAISISADQLAMLEDIAESGIYPGEIEMIDEPGEPVTVASLAQAEALAGIELRAPAGLEAADYYYFIDGGQGRLIVDVANARLLLQAVGADPGLIPDSLDGAVVDVTVHSAVSQQWNDGTVFVQAPSPEVDYPDDVDPVALGEALLQALGMDPVQANKLAQSIDWTTTLLLPIPEGVASFHEVNVDGADGLALTSLDGEQAAIIWEKDGIVYALAGEGLINLTTIANSLP